MGHIINIMLLQNNNWCLISLDMQRDIQKIFKMTSQEKHGVIFSTTLPRDLLVDCKKFMPNVSIPRMYIVIYNYDSRHPYIFGFKISNYLRFKSL